MASSLQERLFQYDEVSGLWELSPHTSVSKFANAVVPANQGLVRPLAVPMPPSGCSEALPCALLCEAGLCFGFISHSLPRSSGIWQISLSLLKDGLLRANGDLFFASRLVLMGSTCSRTSWVNRYLLKRYWLLRCSPVSVGVWRRALKLFTRSEL